MNRRHRERLKSFAATAESPPQSVSAWCAAVAERRDRPIRVVPVSVPLGGPSGLLLQRGDNPVGDEDVIAVADDAAPLLRDHIVLHELAHLLLGHEQLDHDPVQVRNSGERLAQEREAEQYAEDMAAWAIAPRPTAGAALGRPHPVWPAAQLGHPSRQGAYRPSRLRDLAAGTAARHILYRRLHSLWLPLTEATPRVAPLLSPELDQQLPIRGTWAALRRRVVQIYDSLWHLRGHLDPDVYDAACRRARRYGLDERSADIEGHATTIAVAIHTRVPVATAHPPRRLARQGSDDVDLDAARLAGVAHAIKRSPVVAATIATIATTNRTLTTKGSRWTPRQ